jgi:hypothetical protein
MLLAVVEATAVAATEMARQAVATAQATVVATVALLAKMEREELELAGGGSRSPASCRRQSSSPEQGRGRRGHSLVLQTVYRDTGLGTPWPMLTKENYHEWSLLMKVKLQARRLWDVVHVSSINYDDNRQALETLCAAVPTKRGMCRRRSCAPSDVASPLRGVGRPRLSAR